MLLPSCGDFSGPAQGSDADNDLEAYRLRDGCRRGDGRQPTPIADEITEERVRGSEVMHDAG